jgi:hypothetical protein
MHFNTKKCNVMTIARSSPLTKMYQLNNSILQHVDSCDYLGITISEDLAWGNGIAAKAKKANARLGFLKRNLKGCPLSLKRTAYVSLVRAMLEYGSAVWDPHLRKDIDALERTQRRAARWITSTYDPRASVSQMLKQLGLKPLQERRQAARLTFMYKIMHNLVQIPPEDLDLRPADSRTRASHSIKLLHLSPTTKEHRNSFATRTIPEWNRLPACVAEADSLDSFKSQLAALATV